MVRQEIFIRADGNSQIGLGHIVRCLALAQMLEGEFECVFFCREIPDALRSEIVEKGFTVSIICSETEFLERLNKNLIVVIDHYDFNSDFQKLIRAKVRKLVCIDDLHDKAFFVDLVINHAPGIISSDYTTDVDTQFALGLDYVLLRPEFLSRSEIDSVEKIKGSVLVCFGGSDNKNLTKQVIRILSAYTKFKNIIVVTGSAYSYLEDLQLSILGDDRFKLYNAVSPEVLKGLMEKSELAIVPASGILQESLATRCKVISGMYAENQLNIFERFRNLNAFISADEFSDESLQTAIGTYHSGLFPFNNQMIDGKSGVRILKYFRQFQLELNIKVRRVTTKDLFKTFSWANDANVRKFFLNREKVDFEVHKKWFERRLGDIDCFYYVGELDGIVFGSVRFDVSAHCANISYIVDPKYQKKGLGLVLLKCGLDIFREEQRGVSVVFGEVLSQNYASIKVFEKLGYKIEAGKGATLLRFYKHI